MILVNGYPSKEISILDRALQYGDGCFTTVLVKAGKPSSWSYHLSRLKNNTKALGIHFSDWDNLTLWVEALATQHYLEQLEAKNEKVVIKIIISRGEGGRGYSPVNCNSPNIIISSHDFPSQYEHWQENGIKLVLLNYRLGLSMLGGIKHLNRLEQVMVKQELEKLAAQDGVVCDLNGKIVETSASNIFWRRGNCLFTPIIKYAGVMGTMRAQVIAVAEQEGLDVKYVSADPSELNEADEVFITNSLMGLVPVNNFDGTHFATSMACEALRSRLAL